MNTDIEYLYVYRLYCKAKTFTNAYGTNEKLSADNLKKWKHIKRIFFHKGLIINICELDIYVAR